MFVDGCLNHGQRNRKKKHLQHRTLAHCHVTLQHRYTMRQGSKVCLKLRGWDRDINPSSTAAVGRHSRGYRPQERTRTHAYFPGMAGMKSPQVALLVLCNVARRSGGATATYSARQGYTVKVGFLGTVKETGKRTWVPQSRERSPSTNEHGHEQDLLSASQRSTRERALGKEDP